MINEIHAFQNMVVCRKKLARWLLSGQSGGGGHEMLILKLKKQFGNLFTKKMETMVSE